MDKSHGKAGRNFRGGNGPMMAAPVLALDQADYTSVIRETLQRAFASERNPVKRIAAAANTNIRTAKNWWEGRCTPGGLHLLKLMATVPAFQGEVRRLTAMESSLDPEFATAFDAALKAYTKAKGWGP